MKKYLPVFTVLLLSAWFSSASWGANAAVGQPAPNFSLVDTQGKQHTLSDYAGKTVVLEWTNPDCPFVKKHYMSNNMQNLQQSAREGGVVWLSIGSSAPGKQGHYAPDVWNQLTEERGATPTAVLLDPDGQVGQTYGAQTTPHMYVINAGGVLVYQGAIDNIPSTDPEDVEDSENYVRKALSELAAGKPVSTSSTKAYGCSVKY